MKSHFPSYLAATRETGGAHSQACDLPIRRKPIALLYCLLTVFSALLLPGASAVADEELPPMPGASAEHGRPFDWAGHTQHALDELKVKLNLAPVQMTAWNVWSQGVMADGKAQLAQKKNVSGHQKADAKMQAGETTPEKMARGIERLRAETAWMQEHLVQLEAARVRTSTFYDTLDTNQKTIFDLFWHELYHRISGHDQSGNPSIHRIAPPVT
jgi:hypothetical protein